MRCNGRIFRLGVIASCSLLCFLRVTLSPHPRLLADERVSTSLPLSQAPPVPQYWHPSFDPVSARPGLHQVLLIGDSISIEYTLHVRGLLARVADVHRPPANCESTALGLREVDRWLGDRKWDVIHFNWGLHDLKLVKAGEDGNAARSQGKQAVAIEEYEKNLRALVNRLERTGARLIWATTTPVPEGTSNRLKGDEAGYNAAAKRIMSEHGIQVDDLHAFALPRLREIQLPANVHFTAEGSMQLAKQAARCILEALGKVAASGRNP